MKVDLLGNFYLQPYLNHQELAYLNLFSASSHFDNESSLHLGLYDTSVTKENLNKMAFIFNNELDLKRTSHLEAPQTSMLFPFFKSPLNFTEKSIKFSLADIQNKEDFLFYIQYLSQSIFFYYQHFLKNNCHAKVLDNDFFNFLDSHNFSGNLYFKLSDFGEIYRLTATNEKIILYKGSYLGQLNGKNYLISSGISHDKKIQHSLENFYQKLSLIDIKNNALFQEEGTIFTYTISEVLQKMLHYHYLKSKLPIKSKEKIHKI